MAQNNPLVSVIITTYGRREEINGAIETVLSQTYNPIEILVIDDSSEYDISETISSYCNDVNLYINEENRGANWSRAKGIANSEGEYIAFLDDDDRWSPSKIEEQVVALENSSVDVGVCYTGYQTKSGTKVIPENLSNQELTKKLLLGQNIIGGFSSILVRKKAIEQVGLPDIQLASAQDIDWYIRLSRAVQFQLVHEPLVYKNDTLESRITTKSWHQGHDPWKRILNKNNKLLDEYGYRVYKKAWAARDLQQAKYAVIREDYEECRQHSMKGILKWPFTPELYATFIIGLMGKRAKLVANKIKSFIK